MKAKIMSFLLCLGIGFSGSALAAGSPFYLGLKVGRMMADLNEFKDADSFGLLAGYRIFDNASGSLAVEGEYTNSSSADVTVLGVTGKWDIDTLAVYLTYRSGGDLYFKGKIGYLDEDISASILGTSISGSDSGLSVGIGGGWKIGTNSALELEYTLIEEDVNFLSLGVNFSF